MKNSFCVWILTIYYDFILEPFFLWNIYLWIMGNKVLFDKTVSKSLKPCKNVMSADFSYFLSLEQNCVYMLKMLHERTD